MYLSLGWALRQAISGSYLSSHCKQHDLYVGSTKIAIDLFRLAKGKKTISPNRDSVRFPTLIVIAFRVRISFLFFHVDRNCCHSDESITSLRFSINHSPFRTLYILTECSLNLELYWWNSPASWFAITQAHSYNAHKEPSLLLEPAIAGSNSLLGCLCFYF